LDIKNEKMIVSFKKLSFLFYLEISIFNIKSTIKLEYIVVKVV
jgi:hypothetical protein